MLYGNHIYIVSLIEGRIDAKAFDDIY